MKKILFFIFFVITAVNYSQEKTTSQIDENLPDNTELKRKGARKNVTIGKWTTISTDSKRIGRGATVESGTTIRLSSGISTPSSSFKDKGYAENGSYFELSGAYYFSKFGFGASLGQYTNSTDANLERLTNSLSFSTTNTTEDWKITYYGFGPEYTTSFNKIKASFFLRTGILAIKPISLNSNYTENTDVAIPIYEAYTNETSNISYVSTAAKLGYNFNNNFSVFATVDYMSALSNKFTITEKTITDANRNGIIDLEDILKSDATSVTFEETETKIKPQTTNFGIGLSYTFNSKKDGVGGQTHGQHNRGRASGDPLQGMDITVEQSPPGTKGQNNRAKDHNGSRSNTTASKTDPNSNGNTNSETKIKRKRPGRTTYSNITLDRNPIHEDNTTDGENPLYVGDKTARSKNHDKLDEDSDGDGLSDSLEISDGADNDCDSDTLPAKRMNKGELVDSIAKDAGLSKADAKRALESLTANLSKSLKKGDIVQLIGFGHSISARAARTGRNPQTGADVKITDFKRAARTGRNPQTGATIKIASKKGYDYYKAIGDKSKRTNNFQNPQEDSGKTQRNKAELIDAMAKDANLSKADAGKALNAFSVNISKELNNGNCVKLIVPVAINKGIREDNKTIISRTKNSLLRGIEKSDIRRGMKIAPKAKEQTKLSKRKENKKGIYFGKLKFKPGRSKLNGNEKLGTPKGVVLMIREKSTGKIIARTTIDGSGNFKFNPIAIQNGLELSLYYPQQAGEPITDENGCMVKLPSSPSQPLEPIEECDDSELVLRVGLSNCFNPPCP